MSHYRKYWFVKNPLVVITGVAILLTLLYIPIVYATTGVTNLEENEGGTATKNKIVSIHTTLEQVKKDRQEQLQNKYRLDVSKVKSERDELIQQKEALEKELELLKSELKSKEQELQRVKQHTVKQQTKNLHHTQSASTASKTLTAVATAYTAYCKGCSGVTATGINLRENPNAKVIAVDPKVIPLNSKVEVVYNDQSLGVFVAGDTGGAIKGNKIDIFMPSKEEAYNWGRRTVTVRVLD